MVKLIELITYIATDMLEPIGYLPWGIASGCIYLLLLHLYRRTVKHTIAVQSVHKNRLKKDILHFLLIIYGATLLKLTFFSREPGSRTDVSIKLMETWGTTVQEHAFFIENILMFVPFGILLPIIFPKTRHFIPCITSAFLCSVILEALQLITERGFCQLDDIITNTFGGICGYSIYAFLRFINKNLNKNSNISI